jgi:hypothetical protein
MTTAALAHLLLCCCIFGYRLESDRRLCVRVAPRSCSGLPSRHMGEWFDGRFAHLAPISPPPSAHGSLAGVIAAPGVCVFNYSSIVRGSLLGPGGGGEEGSCKQGMGVVTVAVQWLTSPFGPFSTTTNHPPHAHARSLPHSIFMLHKELGSSTSVRHVLSGTAIAVGIVTASLGGILATCGVRSACFLSFVRCPAHAPRVCPTCAGPALPPCALAQRTVWHPCLPCRRAHLCVGVGLPVPLPACSTCSFTSSC